MSAPLRAGRSAPDDDPASTELTLRAREQAEAEAAVAAVMQREDAKAAAIEAKARANVRRPPPLKQLLLLSLMAFNLYAWIGNPEWLRVHVPEVPEPSYYASSWKIAVFLQRQRIEEYRSRKGMLPATAAQAGPPVKGVHYTPMQSLSYELLAGEGQSRFVFHSNDTLNASVARAFLQVALITGGAR
jgi:hypothetical protein